MRINAQCIECLVKRQASFAYRLQDQDDALSFMKEVLSILVNSGTEDTAPFMSSKFERIYQKYSGIPDAYEEEKRLSNQHMINRVPVMRKLIDSSPDRLLTSLRLALVGNYIDFGALAGQVSMDALDGLLTSAEERSFSRDEYASMLDDLSKAGRLLYIADNAGEIVADRLVMEELRRRFPSIHITAAVRGGNIQNDATIEDAVTAGIDDVAEIVESGAAIGGTVISMCSEKMRSELDRADVIIAKGQGNFETLSGCGLNVYYLFMCKCVRFLELFKVPKFTGILTNERRLPSARRPL